MINELKKLVRYGNNKLPKTTAIFNMGSATLCPSKKLGLCKVCNICYAMKAERLYPAVLPYRTRQQDYWTKTSAEQFVKDFIMAVGKKRNPITHLRLNESGDFHSQECVYKAEKIAKLLAIFDIKVYVYTARTDLNFDSVEFLTINGSGFMVGNSFTAVNEFKKNDIKCIGDCKECSLCTESRGLKIKVLKH